MIADSTTFTFLGPNAVVDRSWCSRLLVDRRKDPLGLAPQISFPKPLNCFIGRALHRKLLVNAYNFTGPSSSLHLSAPGGRELVRCDIPQGHKIFINMSSLIAWSDFVNLGTQLSLQWGSMALGSLIYVNVRGPGIVLFELHGKPLVVDASTEDTMSLEPSRIVAWEAGTQFTVTGSTRVLDIYLTQLHLLPSGGGKILVDADAPISGSGGLVKRFFKKFYVPR